MTGAAASLSLKTCASEIEEEPPFELSRSDKDSKLERPCRYRSIVGGLPTRTGRYQVPVELLESGLMRLRLYGGSWPMIREMSDGVIRIRRLGVGREVVREVVAFHGSATARLKYWHSVSGLSVWHRAQFIDASGGAVAPPEYMGDGLWRSPVSVYGSFVVEYTTTYSSVEVEYEAESAYVVVTVTVIPVAGVPGGWPVYSVAPPDRYPLELFAVEGHRSAVFSGARDVRGEEDVDRVEIDRVEEYVTAPDGREYAHVTKLTLQGSNGVKETLSLKVPGTSNG